MRQLPLADAVGLSAILGARQHFEIGEFIPQLRRDTDGDDVVYSRISKAGMK